LAGFSIQFRIRDYIRNQRPEDGQMAKMSALLTPAYTLGLQYRWELREGRAEFLFHPVCGSGVAVAGGAADDGGAGWVGWDGGWYGLHREGAAGHAREILKLIDNQGSDLRGARETGAMLARDQEI
jgi:hypothetical protein